MAFKVILILEYFLLVMDILTNAFSDSFGDSVIHRLAIYVAQDLCLILSLIILFLLFFRTKILRNGLLQQLLKSNWIPFLVSITYITLTIVLQVLIVNKLSLIEEEARGVDAEPRKEKVGESDSESQLHSIGSTSTGKQSRNLDTKIDPRFWMKYPSIVTILVIQRITSALYYFTYRSAMMTLHDPNLIQRFNPIAIGSGTALTSVSSGRLANAPSTGWTTGSSRDEQKWKEWKFESFTTDFLPDFSIGFSIGFSTWFSNRIFHCKDSVVWFIVIWMSVVTIRVCSFNEH